MPPALSEYPEGSSVQGTVVIPAYKEQPNIRPLVERIFHSVRSPSDTQVLIVDDNSQDGTEADVAALQAEGYKVDILVRTQDSGLSSAVLFGLSQAKGTKMIIMDADLQHPPERIQSFFDALSPTTPFALGTRYAPGVSVDKDWPLARKVISWGARMLARPLTTASDPMTGFFGLTRDVVCFAILFLADDLLTGPEQFTTCSPLNPGGFKIALELLLKSHADPAATIAEIPYSFSKRTVGSSKLSSKVMFKYVLQLMSLYRWRMPLLSLLFVEAALVSGFWVMFTVINEGSRFFVDRHADRLTKRKGKHIV